ncbi:class I SAM-dependent methyltransferase [Micromonospora echinofusca]|uniref:class I SAM-dependent methyltransferase n=1 Tax=Micromonospora echinofusca TaxID=47858 RepID=UPI001FCA8C64|nr:class I SAM-dependent methyltransferase [Micromonospora echinofusca]
MNDAAARYIHGHHESVLRSHGWRTAENSAAYLLPHLVSGMSLLDVGCGPGTITAGLAARVAPGPVTALDSSADAAHRARQEISARGNVTLAVADVHALALPDDTFDVTHAHQVLQHVGDPVTALTEMRRVTRPGGLVAARDSDYSAFDWYPRVPELDEWLARYRRAARAAGGEPDAGPRLAGWARAAGFTEIVTSAAQWRFSSEDDRSWWAETQAERVTRAALGRTFLADGADEGDLHRMADGWLRWAAHPDAWFTVPHHEILCRV